MYSMAVHLTSVFMPPPCHMPQDDPFGDSTAAEPAAPEAAEQGAAATSAAGEPAAEEPQAGEQGDEQAAGQGQDEEDEWGDDAFAAAPAPAAPQAAAAADASSALAGLSLAHGSAQSSEVAAAGRQLVLGLVAATASSQDSAVQLPALAALCALLQRQQQEVAAPTAYQAQQLSWALQCAAAALPGAATLVHALMASSSRLGEGDTQVGGERLA